jgi:2-hydroxy-3-keto-5-methylthiopentenyl-1-phosphate phosphatase
VTGPIDDVHAPALTVLVDYDGTIATADVSDEVMRRFAALDSWAPLEAAYLAGEIGSRRLLTLQAELLRDQDGAIEAMADADEEDHDRTFVAFVDLLRHRSIPLEVVSDGFGFFVAPALERMGLGHVPVVTALTSFDRGRVEIDFPNGHPRCLVCGTCKRERILVHQRAGRHVIFIGDGFSDLYAAAHADTVFAKDHLAEICRARGWPFESWGDFSDIGRTIEDGLASGRFATARRWDYVCGPEIWPPGTTIPRWDALPAPRTGSTGS